MIIKTTASATKNKINVGTSSNEHTKKIKRIKSKTRELNLEETKIKKKRTQKFKG